MRKSLSGKGESRPIVIRVSPAMRAELERLAGKDRRILSEYVRLALEDHIAAARKRGK